MIPIRDNIPSRKMPIINYIIIAINVHVFLFQISNKVNIENLFFYFGIVPARYITYSISSHFSVFEQIIPFFSSMFFHGGWLHLIGNMWTLYIFGDNVEDYLGHTKYLILYILGGVFSALFHLLTNLDSTIPAIGASGAIAAIMGAYYILFPKAKVLTILPIFLFIHIIEIRAYVFLGVWFIIQFFNGTLSIGAKTGYCGVAWWTHIGGFIAGAYMISKLKKKKHT